MERWLGNRKSYPLCLFSSCLSSVHLTTFCCVLNFTKPVYLTTFLY